MVVRKIKTQWYSLTSDCDEGRLIWFGYSAAEVKGKFKSYIQRQDLKRLNEKGK